MGVEIHGHLHGFLDFADDGCGFGGIDQTGHIFQSDDFGAESLHLHCKVYEIFVGENLFGGCGSRIFFAEKLAKETFLFRSGRCFFLGVDSVADSRIGYAAKFVDHADRFLDIVDVIEGIEDTHHVQAVGDSFFIEPLEHAVGIGIVTEEVAAAGQCRQQRFAFHYL